MPVDYFQKLQAIKEVLEHFILQSMDHILLSIGVNFDRRKSLLVILPGSELVLNVQVASP